MSSFGADRLIGQLPAKGVSFVVISKFQALYNLCRFEGFLRAKVSDISGDQAGKAFHSPHPSVLGESSPSFLFCKDFSGRGFGSCESKTCCQASMSERSRGQVSVMKLRIVAGTAHTTILAEGCIWGSERLAFDLLEGRSECSCNSGMGPG